MVQANATRKAQKLNPSVIKKSANYEDSKKKARLLTLEGLPKFLSKQIAELEKTGFYKENGRVEFYLDTKGTDMDGAFKFDETAKTLGKMFTQVSPQEYDELPSSQKAFFWGGHQPLRVTLFRSRIDGCMRLVVDALRSPLEAAPVVVGLVPQTQAVPLSPRCCFRTSLPVVVGLVPQTQAEPSKNPVAKILQSQIRDLQAAQKKTLEEADALAVKEKNLRDEASTQGEEIGRRNRALEALNEAIKRE